MSILKVARMGNPILRRPAQPLTKGQIRSAEIQRLIDDMVETLHEYEGVGLAAPQIHAGLRLTVIEVPPSAERGEAGVPLTVLVNPAITPVGEEQALGWEGCLSIPDLRGQVPRHTRIRVEALDRLGKPLTLDAQDFFARVIQHECDHLDGNVYLDRMEDLRTLSFIKEWEDHAMRHSEDEHSED
jgi:peptide deformylase